MAPSFVEPLVFYALSALLVIGALAVVFLPRIIHAALSLVVFFVGIAGVFILLQAEFIAAAQIIIYAGAITVLVLFAVMLTQRSASPESNPFNTQGLIASVVAAALFVALLAGITTLAGTSAIGIDMDLTPALGTLMLGQWVLPFEIASVLLLAALIGAVVIAKEN